MFKNNATQLLQQKSSFRATDEPFDNSEARQTKILIGVLG